MTTMSYLVVQALRKLGVKGVCRDEHSNALAARLRAKLEEEKPSATRMQKKGSP